MSQQWFVSRDGQSAGPFSSAQLKAQAEAGSLRLDDRLRLDGQTKWVKAAAVKGLFENAPAAAVAPQPARPETAQPAAGAEVASDADAAPSPAPPRRPARWVLVTAGAALAVIVVGLVAFSRGKSGASGKQAAGGQASPGVLQSGSDLDDMARLLGHDVIVGRQEFRRIIPGERFMQEVRGRTGSRDRAVAGAARAAEEPFKWRTASLEMAAKLETTNQQRVRKALALLPRALTSLRDVTDAELSEAVRNRQITADDAAEIRKERDARDAAGAGGELAMQLLVAQVERNRYAGPIRWNRKRAEVLEAEVFAKHLAPALRARAGARAATAPIELRFGIKPDPYEYRERFGFVCGTSKARRPLTRVALLVTVELSIGTRYVAAYIPRLEPADEFRLAPFGVDVHELHARPRSGEVSTRGVRYSLWCDELSAEDVELATGNDQAALLAYAAQLARPGSSYLADPERPSGDYDVAKRRALARQKSIEENARRDRPRRVSDKTKAEAVLPDPTRDIYRRFGLTFIERVPQGRGYHVRVRFDRYDAEDRTKLVSSQEYEGTLVAPEPVADRKPGPSSSAKPSSKKKRSAPEPPPSADAFDLVAELSGDGDPLSLRVRLGFDGRLNWVTTGPLLSGRFFVQADRQKANDARHAEFVEKNGVLTRARVLAQEGKKDEAARVVNDFLATSPGARWEKEAHAVLGDLDRLARKASPRSTRAAP